MLAPPPNETPQEKAARLQREAEAARVSDQIDERLKSDRAAWKKQKALFKLLLLGQSESGKSTTLKNMQLAFAPKAWHAERASWRTVIQFNLVRSINTILDVLSQEMFKPVPPAPDTTQPFRAAATSPLTTGTHNAFYRSPKSPVSTDTDEPPPLAFTNAHQLLKLRLTPLRRVEEDLKRLLGAGSEEVTENSLALESPIGRRPSHDQNMLQPTDTPRRRPTEFFVRSNSWRDAVRSAYRGLAGGGHGDERTSGSSDGYSTMDNATEVIAGCGEDMHALWEDRVVQEMLLRRRIRLDQSSGFYLDDIPRIATRNYEPSDDDIVRARLRTVGVQEYRLVIEKAQLELNVAREWAIYDVGGSRTSRAAWFPYFDDADAILFLAPISCFDEVLAEDRRVNRLEDSFLLWKAIVQSKLLSKCIIILFLNKYDLLEKKIRSGVSIRKYLTSFGDRENSAPVLAKYLHNKFRDQQREYSPVSPRHFYSYVTTCIDTKATSKTLSSVRDGIFRHNLHRADFV